MTRDILQLLTKKQVQEIYKNNKEEIDRYVLDEFKNQSKKVITDNINHMLHNQNNYNWQENCNGGLHKIISECENELFSDEKFIEGIKIHAIKKLKAKINAAINNIIDPD